MTCYKGDRRVEGLAAAGSSPHQLTVKGQRRDTRAPPAGATSPLCRASCVAARRPPSSSPRLLICYLPPLLPSWLSLLSTCPVETVLRQDMREAPVAKARVFSLSFSFRIVSLPPTLVAFLPPWQDRATESNEKALRRPPSVQQHSFCSCLASLHWIRAGEERQGPT